MSTGEKRTIFTDKRHLAQQRVKDTFFDYLLLRLEEVTSRVWGSQRGFFGTTSLISGGSDRFSVSGPFPISAIDGDGNILDLEASDGVGVYFENALGIVYSVGMRHCLIPSEVLRNPRNGVVFYDTDEDRIGERTEPDSVAEVAGTLEIVVDSIFEVGVSNANRLVTVWLKRPLTTDESVAIERNVPVVWSGGNNRITTSGILGQLLGSASIDPSEYYVVAQGLTVSRSIDLSVVSPYVFVGTVTGGGAGNPPSGFGVGGQVDVTSGIHPDLQTAYLAGRTITPTSTGGGAVKLQSSVTSDELRALLSLSRKGAAEDEAQCLTLVFKRGDGTTLLSLLPIQDLPDLQEDEPGTTGAAGIVNLTRVGVDAVGAGVDPDHDLVQLWDFTPTTAMNKFYKVASVAAAQLTLTELDGGAPATWGVGETGNVAIHRVRVAIGEANALDSMPSARAPLTATGREPLGADETLIRLYPRGATHALEAMDPGGNAVARLTRHGVVHVVPPGGGATTDPMDALVRLRRFASTVDGQLGLACEMGRLGKAIPMIALGAVANGSELLQEENVDLGTGTNDVVWTRGGVDLTLEALRIRPDFHLVYVYDTVDPAEEGLYVVDVVSAADTIEVKNFDGSTPSFGGDSVKARVLLPRFAVADSATPWGGTVLTGRDAEGSAAPVLVYPEGGTLRVLDNGKVGAVNVPRDLIVVDPSRINPGQIDWPTRLLRSVLIRGGDVTGGAVEESFYGRDGLRIWNAGGFISDRDPAFALAVDYGFPEEIPTYHTWPVFGVDVLGGVARPHHFRDDFIGYKTNVSWTNVYPQPPIYTTFLIGAGFVEARDVADGSRYGHGCVYLQDGGNLNDVAQVSLAMLTPCYLDTGKDFRWTFRGRLQLDYENDCTIRFGFLSPTGNERYYFEKGPTGVWQFSYWNGAALVYSPTTCNALASPQDYAWFQIEIGPTWVAFQIENKAHVAGTFLSGFESISSLSGNNQGVGPALWLRNDDGIGAKSCALDYWEIFDREVLYARMGTSWAQNHP